MSTGCLARRGGRSVVEGVERVADGVLTGARRVADGPPVTGIDR